MLVPFDHVEANALVSTPRKAPVVRRLILRLLVVAHLLQERTLAVVFRGALAELLSPAERNGVLGEALAIRGELNHLADALLGHVGKRVVSALERLPMTISNIAKRVLLGGFMLLEAHCDVLYHGARVFLQVRNVLVDNIKVCHQANLLFVYT